MRDLLPCASLDQCVALFAAAGGPDWGAKLATGLAAVVVAALAVYVALLLAAARR